MPIETTPNGGYTVTGNAMNWLRVYHIRQALEMYQKYGNRFMLTRGATPKRMLGMATEYTGVAYKNTPTGRDQAITDLNAVIAANPDRCKPDGNQG